MLPEIGATELLVIAAVALIVVGPKDLPVLLRKLGAFVARLRGMANEFRTSFDDMARQSELDDLRREVAAMRQSASHETQAVTSQIDAINNDPVLSDMNNALTSPDYEGSIGYDPEWQAQDQAAAAPAEAPAVKASKARAAKPKSAAPKPAAKKASAPKLTVAKVEAAAAPQAVAPKTAKPRSPRKAST